MGRVHISSGIAVNRTFYAFWGQTQFAEIRFKGDGIIYKVRRLGACYGNSLAWLFVRQWVFYFGMLFRSGDAAGGYFCRLFLRGYGVAVIVVAYILAYSVNAIGAFYGKMQSFQKWLNRIVGVLFVLIGLYYGYMVYF